VPVAVSGVVISDHDIETAVRVPVDGRPGVAEHPWHAGVGKEDEGGVTVDIDRGRQIRSATHEPETTAKLRLADAADRLEVVRVVDEDIGEAVAVDVAAAVHRRMSDPPGAAAE